MNINFIEILAAFMVLFAIIDIPGAIPVILDIKNKSGGDIKPMKVTIASFAILVSFLLVGSPLLGIFGIDVSSFAIAGSFIIFLIAMEMILGIELFHNDSQSSSIFPIAFPLIAGAGSITTILSLKAEYQTINIFVALLLNMVVIYFVLKLTSVFEKLFGASGLQILKKVFGVILLSIAIKLFITNTGITLPHVR